MILRFIFSSVVALSLVGCASTTKTANLEESMESFVRALKMKDQMAILAFVRPDHQRDFYRNSLELEKYNISDVEIRTVFPNEDLSKAEMFLDLELFSPQLMSVSRLQRQYLWEYDLDRKAWFLAEKSPFGGSSKTPSIFEEPKASSP